MPARILFVHNHPTKFVQMDRALLGEQYEVREWHQHARTINLPALSRAVAQSDLVFGWFASWHTFWPLALAQMHKRPSLLVVGGYDTACMPEIGYGNQRGGLKRWVTRAAMGLASQLIAFSEFSRQEALRRAQVDPRRICVIHLGLEDCDCPAILVKESVAITVGNVDQVNLKRKGLEAFARAAALLPDIPFILIGEWRDQAIDRLRAIASSNVEFKGWVTDNALRDYLSQARVYVQASLHEGFGLSVAEAMSFECVPVVTRAGSLPEVVGGAGLYLESTQPQTVADGVRRALALDDAWGLRARERIAHEFPLERRRAKLYQRIDTMLDGHSATG